MSVLAQEIQREMDFEVLVALLIETGWHEVNLSRLDSRNHAVDIHEWLDKNCREKYHSMGSKFIFKSHKDATLFALKWL